MIAQIKKFVKDSYTFSPLAFWCEMVEATFLITASAILTFTVLDPATKIFIPLYFVHDFCSNRGFYFCSRVLF